MQGALSIQDVLDQACEQLLTFLERMASNGAAVLVVRSHVQAGQSQQVLGAVIAKAGHGSIREQADRALQYFGVDGSTVYDSVSGKTARGEALRLVSLFRKIHKELQAACAPSIAAD